MRRAGDKLVGRMGLRFTLVEQDSEKGKLGWHIRYDDEKQTRFVSNEVLDKL